MARKVNDYTIPETRGNVSTRAGAIKRIKQVYEANKDMIDDRIREWSSGEGRPPRDFYKHFEQNVLENLSSKYGGDNEYNLVRVNGKKVEQHLRINEALEKSLRNAEYTPYADRARMNFLKGLKKSDLGNVRKLERQLGREIRYTDLKYDSGEGTYEIMVNGLLYQVLRDTDPGRYGFHIGMI